jgi:hypothetical protein
MTSNNQATPPATAMEAVVGIADKVQDKVQDKRDGDEKIKGDDVDGKVTVGMVCEKKDLYQKTDKHNKATWTAKMLNDLDEAAENDETAKYAILIRNSKPNVLSASPIYHANVWCE